MSALSKQRIAALIEHPIFTNFIIGLIVLNGLSLGLETNDDLRTHYAHVFKILDHLILAIFVVEISLRLYAQGFKFFRSGWNLFDLIVVGVSLAPSSGPFAVLRVLRVFRVMRLISVVPQMRDVINALLGALPGMATIVAVLVIFFYVASVLATQAFGINPDPHMQELFGSFGRSMYSLFQVMTLEGWAENVVNPTLVFYPWALFFFIPFIVVTSFAVLNLFIGVIVDSLETIRRKPHDDAERQILEELRALRSEFEILRKKLPPHD